MVRADRSPSCTCTEYRRPARKQTYAHTRTHTHTHAHARTRTHAHARTRTDKVMFTNLQLYTQTNGHMHTHALHAHTYIQCTHTTHVHARARSRCTPHAHSTRARAHASTFHTQNHNHACTQGFKEIKHDLLGLKDAADLYVAGDPNAKEVLFFCAGFPCDHSSFIPLAASLAREPGVLVGVSCMPEYDHDVPLRPEGYDLDQ